MVKTCTECHETKDISEFWKRTESPDGHFCKCKACSKCHQVNYRKENIERERKYHREWSKKERLEHPEIVRERKKKERKNNKEKYAARLRAWKENNRDKVRQYSRTQYQKTKGYHLAYYHKYIAKKNGNGGSYTEQEWLELCEKYNNRCLCCGKKRKLTADHVIPISKGGSSNISNIQPLCKSCNCQKYSKIIDYR